MGVVSNILNVLDAPSNAVQGLLTGGLDDAWRGLTQQQDYDLEELYSDEFRKNNPKTAYISSAVANAVLDPLNLIGVGLLTKGVKGAKAGIEAGANVAKGAKKGSFISSVPNYIQGNYGPTEQTLATAKKMSDGLFSDTMKFTTPKQVEMLNRGTEALIPAYMASKKAGGFLKTGALGAKNIIRNSIDPEARALYRSEKINKGLLETGQLSNKGDPNVDQMHKAFYNMHIAVQSGAVGSKQALSDFSKRFGYKGYEDFKVGSYHKASKGHHKGNTPASKAEANAIETKAMGAWKNRKGVTALADSNTKMFLKRPASTKTGNHWNDLITSNQMNDLGTAFKGKVPTDLDEFAKHLNKQTFRNNKGDIYKPDFKVDKDTGNVWMQFGKSGSSITEGGVNMIVGIKPSGRFVSAVSDEHNFLEKIPLIGRVVESRLPNRVVAITPPMIGNIKRVKKRQVGRDVVPAKVVQSKVPPAQWKTRMADIENTKAKAPDLAYEKGIQNYAYGTSALASGMFTNE